jgi:hypothetical protein
MSGGSVAGSGRNMLVPQLPPEALELLNDPRTAGLKLSIRHGIDLECN